MSGQFTCLNCKTVEFGDSCPGCGLPPGSIVLSAEQVQKLRDGLWSANCVRVFSSVGYVHDAASCPKCIALRLLDGEAT